jgi:predicted glutamine amidotransferase
MEGGRPMCRWLAYSGAPILVEDLLYRPHHSLIVQSLHSTMGAEETNGDGFGVGWYGVGDEPGVFHSIEPAWNDRNLRELARHVRSPLVFAHIRASTGSPVQQTNCHPFRYRNWLWMHNGLIRDFHEVKRDLILEIEPELYPLIEGSTDSEVLFYLALTYGLEHDPPTAVEHTVGLVEEVGREHGVEQPIQMTIATTDGVRVWAFRYSSEGDSRTLFYSTKIETLELMYPDAPVMLEVVRKAGREARLIVSEPLGDELRGAWNSVPERSWGVIQPGQDDLRSFNPTTPARRAAALA